ncbi:helix-turn-helix domain-containing protein [Piscibacillus halophilus]|uniref:Protein RodZ, contains Xre-like HTH and DUF4115 domains n=1 Tax=Piscibacillus halophilus TaxID=571933 RepID=A0A1H8Z580_9BACI|nr:helix-turn-helix domain-containing protein [Piscibacillus halophilus]SEP59417.1 protein RodZ, contains Xre-like HTH and DUF4115 domains [Piscibacillus halophilus]
MQLGEKLKEAREEQGLSLDHIQKETKIQKRYLESLEKNDWSVLPGQFYVRAFVREYAEAVGLDGDALLEEHKEELPTHTDQPYEYVTPSRSNRTSDGSNPMFNFLPKLLVVLLVVVILFAIYYAVINLMEPGDSSPADSNDDNIITAPEDEEEEEPAEEEEEQDTEENEEEVEEEPEEPSTQIEVASSDESSVTTNYEVSNTDQLNLSLESTGENWLEIKGDSVYFSGFINNDNSPLEYEIEEDQVHLNIGSTQGLTIYVNGEELDYEFDPEENDDYIRQHIYIDLVEE